MADETTTEDVRHIYCREYGSDLGSASPSWYAMAGERFDRWLAEHDRKVAEAERKRIHEESAARVAEAVQEMGFGAHVFRDEEARVAVRDMIAAAHASVDDGDLTVPAEWDEGDV